jgi:hypothetical protein
MDPIISLLKAARTLTVSEFVAQQRGHFLLKRPRRGARPLEEPTFGFQTVVAKLDIDPFCDEWRIVPVTKRPGNPFPERMTVGRTTNCDIVLRFPFISKVHAHILREPGGGFSVHDNRPQNFSFYQGRMLPPGSTQKLSVGDSIGFGSLEFEFVDAARLHEILRAEAAELHSQ